MICLVVLFALGLQSVTASDFFLVKKIEVRGVERASKDDIYKLVSNSAERTGAWHADLDEIKGKIEKLAFVKTASVSRILPDGLSVAVVERIPVAIVRMSAGSFLADVDGNIIAPARDREKELPVTLIGWDEAKTEKAYKENLERMKLYQKMVGEWRDFDIASRVKSVDLSDLKYPKAITEDSGMLVSIDLGREAFTEHLKKGISAIVGKGATFDAVNLVGQNMILSSRSKIKESQDGGGGAK